MEETTYKVCFKCGRSLPISEFYRHSQMGDRHLNKCKDCTKKDVHEKYMENINSDEYVEKERARGREKFHRLYSGLHIKSTHKETANVRKWFNKRTCFIPSNFELHHWNYNRLHSVFVVSRRTHSRIHNTLNFNKETKTFVVKETGELLNDIFDVLGYIIQFTNKITIYDY